MKLTVDTVAKLLRRWADRGDPTVGIVEHTYLATGRKR